MTKLCETGAENLEKSLERLKEKDEKIKNLQEAIVKNDSVTKLLINQLKSQNNLSLNSLFFEKNKHQILNDFLNQKIKKIDKKERPYEYEDARDFIIYDIDNDGVEDLLVFYTLEGFGGGNNWKHYLAIFKLSNNKSTFIDEIVLFGDVYGHKYNNGKLIKKESNKLYFDVYTSGFGGEKQGSEKIVVVFKNGELSIE